MKNILKIVLVFILMFSFSLPTLASDIEINVDNQNIEKPDSSPVVVSPEQTSIEVEREKIVLTIGEEKKIAENISLKLIKLMEVELNQDCSKTFLEPCYNIIELKIKGITKSINLFKSNPYQINNELIINLVEKINDNSGVFYIIKNAPNLIEIPIEIQKEDIKKDIVDLEEIQNQDFVTEEMEKENLVKEIISEPLPYQFFEIEEEESKESISVSPDKITIYNPEKEIETSYPVSSQETKSTIKIEVGEGISDSKEIFIKPVQDKVIWEIVKGATIKDCSEYLLECKKGDEILCQKYEFNCRNLEKQTCENYLLSCRKGNEEACQKWDLNCKKTEITTETCGKLLSLCQSGILEGCKEYNNSCQQKEIITTSTKEELKIQNEKIYMNEKEVKIMPDTASEKAIETLSLRKELEIELKDTGKPVYEIQGKQEVRILGLFKARMSVSVSVNGETGEIENVKKPWWRFLVF